ncbi:MAG: hypothetical protein II892_03760 [Fibrobacter sp.]|jgi:hypothetical protein|nr:hypothetical protein [Fibrobacter sp.]
MKHLILFLAIFGVILANAQEMDTTFVVNEQGQTIGVIHEKGTVPVIPQQQPMPQPQMQPQMQPQPQMQYQANPAFDIDSTSFYQSQIERYTHSGNKLNRAGIGMMIGGGIGTAVGLGMFIVGMDDANCEETYANNYECDGNALNVGGYILMTAGVAVFTTGLVLKIVGGSKIRRANRYQESLTNYQMRRQYSLKMRLDPTINLVKNKVGARLAMEF